MYDGRVVHLSVDRVRLPDGSRTDLEVVRHSGASAVVPLNPPDADPGTPTLLLLRQYRYAAGGRIWEVPAGTLDPGETPEECALRELEEEAGLRAGRLEHLTRIHTSPGFTDEVIHLFLAAELEAADASPEANEFLEPRRVSVAEALRMVERGEVVDAKTICALMYAARFAGLDRADG